jgi:transcription antitermination factor NusG
MNAADGAVVEAAQSGRYLMFAVAPGQNEPLDGKGPKAALTQIATPWYAIWTHSHCEQLVSDQLAGKGFELFFPKTDAVDRPGQRRLAARPLFPGYVFVHHPLDKASYVEVLKARGVVRVLGQGWDALAPVAHEEIDTIHRVLAAGTPILEHVHLSHGDRVRIVAGPLAGVCGIFLRSKPGKGLLVLSINLLQRSVAVEVPLTLVEAA